VVATYFGTQRIGFQQPDVWLPGQIFYSRRRMASGQNANRPLDRVWDSAMWPSSERPSWSAKELFMPMYDVGSHDRRSERMCRKLGTQDASTVASDPCRQTMSILDQPDERNMRATSSTSSAGVREGTLAGCL